jgi:alpha-N-acetylglucosaminidase
MLSSPAARSGSATLDRDLVDVEKRWLAECATAALARARDAYADGDLRTLDAHGARYLEVLRDIDTLLGTRPEHCLSRWIDKARANGATEAEADYYERNARMQVTVWGGPVLYDYAWKEWSGLVSSFYGHRWALALHAAKRSLKSGVPLDQGALQARLARWEAQWCERRDVPRLPAAATFPVAQRLHAKYADWLVRYGPDRGIAVGKPVVVSGGTQDGHPPELAVDGNAGDPWGGSWWATPAPQWLTVDLGAPTVIDAVRVYPFWADGRAYQYTVAISLDNATWTVVGDRSTNERPATAMGELFRLAPQQARYVRVSMLHNTANEAVHLTEVRVFAP